MKQLNQRLAKLETVSGKGRLIVVVGPDGFDVDHALDRHGVSTIPTDLVIAVHGKPEGFPVTVKVDGSPVGLTTPTPEG